MRGGAGALPVEQRGVDVQMLHRHLNAPVGVAGRRHRAGGAAAQVAQVGEFVVGDGGQGAADGVLVHGHGRRGRSGRRPVSGVPAVLREPQSSRCKREGGKPARPSLSRALGIEAGHSQGGQGQTLALLEPERPRLLCSGSSQRRRVAPRRSFLWRTWPWPARAAAAPAWPSGLLPQQLLRRRQWQR